MLALKSVFRHNHKQVEIHLKKQKLQNKQKQIVKKIKSRETRNPCFFYVVKSVHNLESVAPVAITAIDKAKVVISHEELKEQPGNSQA